MKLTCRGRRVFFEGDREEWKTVRRALTGEDPNQQMDAILVAGQWVSGKCLARDSDRSFGIGLLPLLAARLGDELDVELAGYQGPGELVEVPVDFLQADEDPEGFQELRPYQVTGISLALAHRMGVVWAGTGSGKTEMQAAVAGLLDGPVLTICKGKAARDQTLRRFKVRGLADVDTLQHTLRSPGARVLVTNAEFLGSRLRAGDREVRSILEELEAVQFDECHHLGSAPTWQEASAACTNAEVALGYSGTPWLSRTWANPHPNDLQIMSELGPTVMEVPSRWLRDQRYLAKTEVRVIRVAEPKVEVDEFDEEGEPISDGEYYRRVYEEGVTENVRRNQLILNLAGQLVKRGRKPVIIVRFHPHGQKLLHALDRTGFKVRYVCGSETAWKIEGGELVSYRSDGQDELEGYAAGDIDLLVASLVWEQSVDIPFVTDAINAAGEKSFRRTIQRVGRIVRRTQGKADATFWDLDDQTHSTLRRHSQSRRRDYRLERFDIIRKVDPALLAPVHA